MARDNMERIISTLEKENKIYRELLSLSNEKKDYILEGKVKEIDKIVQIESSLIIEISKLEKVREATVQALAEGYGLPQENLTVSYISEKIKDPRSKILAEITDSISKTLVDLKEINDTNGKLLEQSLEYINFSVNLINSSLEPQNGVYEAKTGETTGEKRSLFDAKV